MKNNKFIYLSRLIAGLIFTIFISYLFINIPMKDKKEVKCKDCLKTEDLLKKQNGEDLNDIKKVIEKAHEKEEVIEEEKPSVPVTEKSPKEAFRYNNAVIMGDSFVEGMNAYEVLYEENTIWTRGKRIDNFYDDLDKAILKNPNILILVYGSNDVQMWGSNVNSFINAYSKAINTIKEKLPNTKIYICSIFEVSESAKEKDNTFINIPLFNEKLKMFADENNITFIDSSYIIKENSDPYSYDGIHPKAFFYPKWASDIVSKTNMR